MKIETLIHTADGKLEVDDPLLRVGTRGVHIYDPNWRWIITEDAIEYTNRSTTIEKERRVCVKRVSAGHPARFVGLTPLRMRVKNLTIVEPNDPRYFEMKGY